LTAKPLITTSWDDGSPLDLRVAELLTKYGLQGTFYIPLQPGTPVLAESDIRNLSSRFEVGAHTVRHIPLTRLSNGEVEKEMAVSRAEIERITGERCGMFCFPQGKHTRAHLRLARKAGFHACRTVAMLSLAPPAEREGILVMPTSAQVHSHSGGGLLRNLAKRGAIGPVWNWLRCGLHRDWSALAGALLEQTLAEGGVFHLWGHSWEIDQYGQWDRLDAFLRLLGDSRGHAPALTNRAVCSAMNPSAPKEVCASDTR